MHACVHAWVRASVRACVGACEHAWVRGCACQVDSYYRVVLFIIRKD